MVTRDFLLTRPVFTSDEFEEFLASRDSLNAKTRDALLRHYVDAGHILRVRRGVFLTVPPGTAPGSLQVDPYLLAGKMTSDSVLAYHTALEFHGRAYSTYNNFVFLTTSSRRPSDFRGNHFQGVSFPKPLREKHTELFGVETADRSGLDLRVTSLERTLVDVLDRPSISGGWEEIWRSLESVEYLDLDQVVEYALLLDNSTTTAKVGFYLEHHRDALMVEDPYLLQLQQHSPHSPHYMERNARKSGRLVSRWNLVVPARVLDRSWEEQ